MHKPTFYEKYIKRLLDIILSLTALIVLSPIFLITALLVKIKLGSPVIFTQVRPGKDENLFKMYKFRTMTDERDEHGNLLPDEKRLTSFGKKLRSTSLDELPELINILKGEMSFVGPRPLRVKYLDRYDDFQKRRHEIKPGLTGLAQVSGRNALDWETRFKKDVYYVDNVSFWLDFQIVYKTFFIVIKKENIDNDGKIMSEFKGGS